MQSSELESALIRSMSRYGSDGQGQANRDGGKMKDRVKVGFSSENQEVPGRF